MQNCLFKYKVNCFFDPKSVLENNQKITTDISVCVAVCQLQFFGYFILVSLQLYIRIILFLPLPSLIR